MTVTVNTDASFLPDTKEAGYAFYIKCDLFTTRYSGKFHTIPENIYQAEQMALANALASLSKHTGVDKMKYLVINTNSQHTIDHLESPVTDLDFCIKSLLSALIAKNNCKYKLKHVPSHSGTKDSRSWVNEWCDEQAKAEAKSTFGVGAVEHKSGSGPWKKAVKKGWLNKNKRKYLCIK